MSIRRGAASLSNQHGSVQPVKRSSSPEAPTTNVQSIVKGSNSNNMSILHRLKHDGGVGSAEATGDFEGQAEEDTVDEEEEEKPPKPPTTATMINQSSNLYKFQLMCTSTASCCLNMLFQEGLLRLAPKSSNTISFVQHIFITAVGLARFGLPFGLAGSKPPLIPVRSYLPLVALNLISVLANNASINYGVSIPLNMIFKSSSLIANMLLGMIILHHRYPIAKYISVLLITSGLILCTFEDYNLKFSSKTSALNSTLAQLNNATTVHNNSPLPSLSSSSKSLLDSQPHDFVSQTIGIVFLTISLLLSSGTGIYQEHLRNKFGKHPDESLWYVHLLSLPFFAVYSFGELGYHWKLFSESALNWTTPVPSSGNSNRMLIVYLLMTVLTQYACIRSVYKLTTECVSLTVTLVVTNRKFLSIIFSIFYFGNPFTLKHWMGTFIVFGGTLLFTSVDFGAKAKPTVKQRIPSGGGAASGSVGTSKEMEEIEQKQKLLDENPMEKTK